MRKNESVYFANEYRVMKEYQKFLLIGAVFLAAYFIPLHFARVQNAITLVFTSIGDAGALKILSGAAGDAGLALTGIAGAIQVTGAALNALYDGFAKADFSKFNEAVDAAIGRILGVLKDRLAIEPRG